MPDCYTAVSLSKISYLIPTYTCVRSLKLESEKHIWYNGYFIILLISSSLKLNYFKYLLLNFKTVHKLVYKLLIHTYINNYMHVYVIIIIKKNKKMYRKRQRKKEN